MRCFIAINTEEALKREITKAVIDLRQGRWDVKWVQPENLHITLKFLGEIPEALLQPLKVALSRVSANHTAFSLAVRGTGVFPDRKRPRVLWVDITDPDRLIKLQTDIETAMTPLGFSRGNEAFSPHLTIGRVKSSKNSDLLLKTLDTIKERDFGNISVSKISLMKSDLTPTGAHYTVLADFPLKRRDDDNK